MTRTRRSEFPKLLSGEVLGFDKFGFAIFSKDQSLDSERHHVYKRRVFPKEETFAWERLFEEWDQHKNRLDSKVHTYLRRGVPLHLRSTLWKLLLNTATLKSTIKFNYQEELGFVRRQLVDLGISEYGSQTAASYLSELEMDSYRVRFDDISMDALRHIFLDLERSYPSHRLFMGNTPEAKEGRASLFRVLATYARYNRNVEYCQGMASIAGMFLMQMDDEEEAFWCLLSLLERQKYLLGYFENSMDRLKNHAAVFDKLLVQRFPRVQEHLVKLGMNPLMYLTPWFMVLYTNLPCWDSVLAIWDLLLIDGNKTIFRVALSLLEAFEEEFLLKKDICDILPALLHPPIKHVEYDTLLPLVWNTYIEDWEISSLIADICDGGTSLSPQPASQEKTPLLDTAPHSGQKRKRSESSNPKVVTFTGEEDRRKRLRKTLPDKTDTKPLDNIVSKLEEGSVFKRFVNIFTPKPQEGVSPKPTSRSNKKSRTSSGKEKRRSLRRSQHSREQLHIPGIQEKGFNLNIDKRGQVPVPKPTGQAGSILKKNIEVHSKRISPKTVKIVTDVKDSHPLRSVPSSVENSPAEIKQEQILSVERLRAENVSPCTVADENSFNESERLAALKLSTPLRRSPRLQQQRALKDINNTKLSLKSVLSQIKSRHTFQSFASVTPLRQTQTIRACGTPPFISSPVVELRSMKHI